MDELKCNNCGAPLKIRPRDIRRGMATCEFCNNTYSFGEQPVELDEETKKGLKMLTKFQGLLGIEDDDPDEPASKPFNSKIDLESHPGHLFRASIPSAGFSLGNGFMLMFTLFWCGFMVVWNAIGIATGEWIMLGFGLLHDAVGAVLLLGVLWSFFGKEELSAQGETFTRTKKVFGIARTKTFEMTHIDDVVFRVASNQNKTPRRGLYLLVGTKKVRIASNASYPELKWIRQQLLLFFKPRW